MAWLYQTVIKRKALLTKQLFVATDHLKLEAFQKGTGNEHFIEMQIYQAHPLFQALKSNKLSPVADICIVIGLG